MRELCIGGEWRDARSGATRTIRCPADGTVVAEVAEGGRADAEDAIAAARAAFDAGRWSDTSWAERADLVGRVGDLLQRDREALARSESLDTGKRLVESLADIDDVTAVFRHYATIRHRPERLLDVGRGDVTSRVVREPVGVCGLITPWNYPMLQAAWKVAPCLLAGNTFVLKPSELTPHTAVLLTRLLHEAGLPDGVANLVLGPGPAVGAPLAADPRVDLVSFTGGLATGKAIMKSAADTVKRVALELGGRTPISSSRTRTGRRPSTWR